MISKFSQAGVTGAALVAVVVGVLLILAAAVAFNAWLLMLLVGAIFPHFGWDTWGYGLSVLVSLGLSFIGSFFRAGVNVSR